MTKETVLESIAGNPATKTAANALAVMGATITPWAACLPFLVDTFAAGRQRERLKAMSHELTEIINAHSQQLQHLSDDQYKVITESISAAFYTIDQDKLAILKNAAANALSDREAVANVADALSRVIRDISVAEAMFVVKNYGYHLVAISEQPNDLSGDLHTLSVFPNSEDEIVLSGLLNLGLLYAKVPRLSGSVAFEWSPLVVKLLRLLKAPT